MRLWNSLRSWTKLLLSFLFLGSSLTALAGQVTINSPANGASVASQVPIVASSSEDEAFHLELWDNGSKLGDVFSNVVNTSVSLSAGGHTLTVLAVSTNGIVLDSNSVKYTVSSAQGLQVNSPAQGSTISSAVRITASADVSGLSHLEVWDNGFKLGNISASSVNGVYVLPSGSHVMTVLAVASDGSVLAKQDVAYQVAETCSDSSTVQCDLDQLPADNTQGDCDPPLENAWVANPCGSGVQGDGADPISTWIDPVSEGGVLPDQENLTLSGHSVHLLETENTSSSNVLFRSQSPSLASATTPDVNWTLDGYVYLPNPTAHQAFEVDAQYTVNDVWTKFYTECAFNMNKGTGYWAVFDSNAGGWIFLNGQPQDGQTPPVVPCNRSQFAQPWSGSSNPSFTGWHHITWNFTREADGTVTYQSLTFDSTTTQINFHPNSADGGQVNDSGHFGALIQLDGVSSQDGGDSTVDAYISELSLTHTP